MFEDIDGTTPRTPWQPAELDRVLRAIEELSAGLTPAPIGVEPVGELMPNVFAGWQRLAAGVESGQDECTLRTAGAGCGSHRRRCCRRGIHDPGVTPPATTRPPDGAGLPARPGLPALEWLKRRTGWT